MLNVSFRIKQDRTELWRQRVTVSSVARATTMLLLGMCDCTADCDVGSSDFSLVMRICTCVGTRTYDRAFLRAWIAVNCLVSLLECFRQHIEAN